MGRNSATQGDSRILTLLIYPDWQIRRYAKVKGEKSLKNNTLLMHGVEATSRLGLSPPSADGEVPDREPDGVTDVF